MSSDLNSLTAVTIDQGTCQWVQGKVTGTDDTQADRTHTVGVPDLMPGVTILVHGVNSDSEWNCVDRDYSGVNVGTGRCA